MEDEVFLEFLIDLYSCAGFEERIEKVRASLSSQADLVEQLIAFLHRDLAAVSAFLASSIWVSGALEDTRLLRSLDSLRDLA